jgi:hypothetical protein
LSHSLEGRELTPQNFIPSDEGIELFAELS